MSSLEFYSVLFFLNASAQVPAYNQHGDRLYAQILHA